MSDEIWLPPLAIEKYGYIGKVSDQDTRYIKAPTNEGDVDEVLNTIKLTIDMCVTKGCEDENINIIRNHISQQDAALSEKDKRIAELEEVLADVIAISDRKHDAWDRAKEALKTENV